MKLFCENSYFCEGQFSQRNLPIKLDKSEIVSVSVLVDVVVSAFVISPDVEKADCELDEIDKIAVEPDVSPREMVSENDLLVIVLVVVVVVI